MLRILLLIACNGGHMPTYVELGKQAGCGKSSARRSVHRLIELGILRLETTGGQRRIVFLPSGKATEWGAARPGHAPYSKRKRGEPIFITLAEQVRRLPRERGALPVGACLNLGPPPWLVQERHSHCHL